MPNQWELCMYNLLFFTTFLLMYENVQLNVSTCTIALLTSTFIWLLQLQAVLGQPFPWEILFSIPTYGSTSSHLSLMFSRWKKTKTSLWKKYLCKKSLQKNSLRKKSLWKKSPKEIPSKEIPSKEIPPKEIFKYIFYFGMCKNAKYFYPPRLKLWKSVSYLIEPSYNCF